MSRPKLKFTKKSLRESDRAFIEELRALGFTVEVVKAEPSHQAPARGGKR